MTNDTLRPPEEYAHLRWHWIKHTAFVSTETIWPELWAGEHWGGGHGHHPVTPAMAILFGWYYYGPCDPAATALDPENAEQQKIVRQILAPDYDHPIATDHYKIKADDLTRRVLTALREYACTCGYDDTMAKEVEGLRARLSTASDMLLAGAGQFRFYEEEHYKKGANEKAFANKIWADKLMNAGVAAAKALVGE